MANKHGFPTQQIHRTNGKGSYWQCEAKSVVSKERCKAPVTKFALAKGLMRCRYHGGSKNVLSGKAQPNHIASGNPHLHHEMVAIAQTEKSKLQALYDIAKEANLIPDAPTPKLFRRKNRKYNEARAQIEKELGLTPLDEPNGRDEEQSDN
jgi:hypothetical protein